MYASLRTYRNVERPEEVARRLEAGLVPLLRALPGFQGCYLFRAEERTTAVSLFATREGAAASLEAAAAWAREGLANLGGAELVAAETGKVLAAVPDA